MHFIRCPQMIAETATSCPVPRYSSASLGNDFVNHRDGTSAWLASVHSFPTERIPLGPTVIGCDGHAHILPNACTARLPQARAESEHGQAFTLVRIEPPHLLPQPPWCSFALLLGAAPKIFIRLRVSLPPTLTHDASRRTASTAYQLHVRSTRGHAPTKHAVLAG